MGGKAVKHGTRKQAPAGTRMHRSGRDQEVVDQGADAVENGASMAIVKATTVDVNEATWGATERNSADPWGGIDDLVRPPIDLATLYVIFRNSNVLPQCVEAYVSAVDAFGHRAVPVVDPKGEDYLERLADLEYQRRVHEYEAGTGTGKKVPVFPEGADLDKVEKKYTQDLRYQLASVKAWLGTCVEFGDLVDLRKLTRTEREGVGNACWEVLRNRKGAPARFNFVSSLWMLPTKAGKQVEVKEKIRVGTSVQVRKVYRRFRRWVQLLESGARTWFKEFGDPRYVSRDSGEVFADKAEWEAHQAELKAEDKELDALATEIVHWKIPDSRTAMGTPRWYGALRSVLGSTAMEEVNVLYFDDKAIPPMVVFVEGGRLARGVVPRLQEYFKQAKGRRNFHKMLVLEAVPQGSNKSGAGSGDDGTVKIKMEPLMQLNDAVFQGYDEANRDKAAESMRVHRILRGAVKDFNRATAVAALAMFESQVAQPLREEFDREFDRFLVERGMNLVRFETQAPITRDAETQAKIVEALVRANVLTPAEGRMVARDILNAPLPELDAEWTTQPMALTLAGISTNGAEPAPAEGDEKGGKGAMDGIDANRPDRAVRRLRDLRQKMVADATGLLEKGAMPDVELLDEKDALVIRIPMDEMMDLVVLKGGGEK